LLGKVFINRGDCIVVEAPTYLGALQAWNAYGAEYVPVPSDEEGMITGALDVPAGWIISLGNAARRDGFGGTAARGD
jgi:hypothetical protein